MRSPACKQTTTRLLSSPRSFMSIKCLFFCRKRASALPALLFFTVEPTPTAQRGGVVFFADRTRCNLIVQGRTTLLTFREKSGQNPRRSRTHSQRSKQEDFDYSWREHFSLCFSPLRSWAWSKLPSLENIVVLTQQVILINKKDGFFFYFACVNQRQPFTHTHTHEHTRTLWWKQS